MSDGIRESDWFVPDELTDEDREEIGLDDEELSLLRMRIERPEVGDPVLHFLPVKRSRRGGGRR